MAANAGTADHASIVDEKLASVITPMTWTVEPVANLSTIEALPPAARDRELKSAANTFASTGRNVFVHYTAPILAKRRELLLATATTKKKFPKTAAQLWPTVSAEEAFFWNEAARHLRLCLKQGAITARHCVEHAGKVTDREEYCWHAGVAVAEYLGIPIPCAAEAALVDGQCEDTVEVQVSNNQDGTVEVREDSNGLRRGFHAPILLVDTDTTLRHEEAKSNSQHHILHTSPLTDSMETVDLLDTLPDRFEYEQNMLYSHFAKYDYDDIRGAEGKRQKAMLRQLADRFDKTGKVLFYYYVVPRLCKQTCPPSRGDTVIRQAADLWRSLPGGEKGAWLYTSAALKKQLGDGDALGLQMLHLDGLEPEVIRLHGMSEAAISTKQSDTDGPEPGQTDVVDGVSSH